jgi:hypothetical protein
MDKIENVTAESIDTMIDTNVKGLLYVTQAILPIMREQQKGHIINIGSVSGKFSFTCSLFYFFTIHLFFLKGRKFIPTVVFIAVQNTQLMQSQELYFLSW